MTLQEFRPTRQSAFHIPSLTLRCATPVLHRHAAELSKWEGLVAEARREQAAAAAAAHEAQRAQQLADASRGVLAGLERALDAREAKLQDRCAGLPGCVEDSLV